MLDYKDIIQNTTLWVSVVIIRESEILVLP